MNPLVTEVSPEIRWVESIRRMWILWSVAVVARTSPVSVSSISVNSANNGYKISEKHCTCTEHIQDFLLSSPPRLPRQQCSSCFHSLGILGILDMTKSVWEDLCGVHANAILLYVTDLSVYGFRYSWKVLKPNSLSFYCPRENSLEKHEVNTINLSTKRVIIMPLVFWTSNVHGHSVGQRRVFIRHPCVLRIWIWSDCMEKSFLGLFSWWQPMYTCFWRLVAIRWVNLEVALGEVLCVLTHPLCHRRAEHVLYSSSGVLTMVTCHFTLMFLRPGITASELVEDSVTGLSHFYFH